MSDDDWMLFFFAPVMVLMLALALASCAERPRPITAAGMEQIARDWQAMERGEK